MKPILAAAASVAMALAPAVGSAQSEDEATERLNLQQIPTEAAQDAPNGQVASVAQQQELGPFGTVPTGAVVFGGVVITGTIIAIAASGDNNNTPSTTSTNTR